MHQRRRQQRGGQHGARRAPGIQGHQQHHGGQRQALDARVAAALADAPAALGTPGPLLKGLKMLWRLRRAGVPMYTAATQLRIEGENAARAVSFVRFLTTLRSSDSTRTYSTRATFELDSLSMRWVWQRLCFS